MSVDFWTRKPSSGPSSWDSYWETLQAPHRDALISALSELPAFETLLEVGCGPGVNLFRVLQAFPDVDVTGVDVSQAAIDNGEQRFESAMGNMRNELPGRGRVALCAGELPEALEVMEPVDVVISCYALAYVPPSYIQAAIQQLLTLATKAVVIMEPMVAPGLPPGVIPQLGHSRPLEYRYDYMGWFQLLSKGWRVTALKPVIVDRMNRLLVAERVKTL